MIFHIVLEKQQRLENISEPSYSVLGEKKHKSRVKINLLKRKK